MTARAKDGLAVAVGALIGVAAFIVLFVAAAFAHQAHTGWVYDSECCFGDHNTGDCQQIDSRTVEITSQGYRITLKPGDHRKVTKPHVFIVPQSAARKSMDGDYHLCLWPSEDDMRCFYAPPPAT
ncbi:hypothetical protein [Pseudorhodoplanes sp.]|uniref:hypothetical protein n=1 Tax=Pseudorhodoplanes sp. TaxID=1934341 RepID=UPI002BE4CEE3|nr:hypothetical protein [Pseudorhodoplanes sp.]HWV44143.1 hypothetical protein [Pseudorhodoplanes sp.]